MVSRYIRDITKAGLTAHYKTEPDWKQYSAYIPAATNLVDSLVVKPIADTVSNYISGKYKSFRQYLSSTPDRRLLVTPVMKYRRRNVRRRSTRRVRRTKRRGSNRSRTRTVSQQKSAATEYVRGRRGRGGSFAKRVYRAIISEQPTFQITRQSVGTVSWLAGNQNFFGTMMYQVTPSATGALGATLVAGADSDIPKMFDFLNNTVAASVAVSNFQSRKLYVKMGNVEMYITNTTATSQIEVDIYEIVCRRSYDAISTIDTAFSTLFAQTTTATGGAKTANDPSVTVFQNNAFCKHFAVMRMTTHLIEPNKTIKLNMTSNKSFMYEGTHLQSEGLCLRRAKGFFCMAKTMPASGASFPAGSIAWGYTKRYRFQKPPSFTDNDQIANT